MQPWKLPPPPRADVDERRIPALLFFRVLCNIAKDALWLGFFLFHFIQRLLQIEDQIAGLLEADVQPDEAMAIVGALFDAGEVVGHGEAGDARPTVSNLEQLQCIHEAQYLLLRELRREYDGKYACRSAEI